jgi:hypothetical protein
MRLKVFIISLLCAVTAVAQVSGTYYRVKNKVTERYISVVDDYGYVDYNTTTADFNALKTIKGFDLVTSDPSSVILVKKISGGWDLQTQGTGCYSIINYAVQIQSTSKGYLAYAQKGSITKFLADTQDLLNPNAVYSKVKDGTGDLRYWDLLPVSASGDNYFGLKPDVVSAGSYYQTFYASFPFTFASTGMEAYYVKSVVAAKSAVIIEKVSGGVAAATPVIVKCSSNTASSNRLNVGATGISVTGNQLKGVYFCNDVANTKHRDVVSYDASTMRVLGTASDGSLAFVKSSTLKYIPANTAYITVPSTAPDVLKVYTQAQYDEELAAKPLTVTVNNVSRQYGATNPTFSFTSSVSSVDLTGKVSFSCDAVATSAVGDYTINATVTNAPENYEVTVVPGKLTVTPAELTAKAKNVTREYGEENPTFEIEYTGFVNNESASVLSAQPTATTVATKASAVGDYDISVSGGAATNYTITRQKGTLTIGKAPLTVTAQDATGFAGDPLPTFQLTYTGFKNGETSAVLTTVPQATTTATAASAANTYPITVSGGEATNYSFNYVAGTLTLVEKDNIVITAKSYEITYGDALPQFGYDVTGGTLNGIPTVSCTATAGSPAGTYDIMVAKGTVTNNANFTFTKGTLTIKKATLTATAANATRVYGQANPQFTVTYSGFVNGEDESVVRVKATASTDATVTSPVGSSYAITPSGASADNYNISYVNGQLTITKAMLTATAANKSRQYGSEDPELTINYQGFAEGDDASKLATRPVATTTATAASAVGTYDITVAGGADNNYDFTYHKGTLTVTKALLTATADDKERQYGAQNPALTISYSGFKNGDDASKLATQPTASTMATATSTADREYDITVAGGSDTNYDFSYVAGKLKVNKALLTATADDKERAYGQVNPEFTVTYSGFLNGDSEEDLKTRPTASTEATASSAVGNYPITLSGGEALNYTLTLNGGTLKVNKATLKVTALNAECTYGDDIPALTVSYDGFVNGDNSSVLTTQPTVATEATPASAVGNYAITVSGGTAANYTITEYNAGTLTIKKATLTVTAKDAQRYVDDENPVFELEYNGFKNGDDASVLTSQPTVNTEATAQSAIGTYPIVVSGGEAANYTLTYVNGILTVADKETITITAKSVSRAYGDANPTLEYTVIGGDIEGTPLLSCDADATSPVGEYVITVEKGSITTNAKFVFHNGKLTVTPATLTVTTSATRTYGAENPDFTLSYAGFKNNETADVLTTLPTAVTEATTASSVGNYPITVSGGTAQNYTVAPVNGTLTVTKAPLAVTADDATRVYGQNNPDFTVRYSGFVNNETVDVLTTQPTATTAATKMSDAGTYPITVTGGVAQNYELTAVGGTLTITKAPLKVTVQDAECEYGTLPTFTIAYEGFINGDDEKEFVSVPVAQTTATVISPVGQYDVTVTGGEARNYAFTEYVSGTLTVVKAPLTVSAVDVVRYVGEQNPAFELSYSGFKNGETASVLTS